MEIQIDSKGLSAISAAGQSVTLMRCVNQVVGAAAVTGKLAVAWQAFQPLQTNAVDWTDQYYCFATTTPLVMNAVITMNAQSDSPLQLGVVYQFAQGQFTRQQQQGDACYIVNNATQDLLAFGLAQSATVNSQAVLAPLCAVPVLYNEAAYFSPSATIDIFLSSARGAGTLLPPPANPCRVTAKTSSGSKPTIGFNDPTNTFYVMS